MEPDRFQQNSRLFILGILALLGCLCLLVFGLFILPFLVWNVHYDVPEFVSFWREGLKENFSLSHSAASFVTFLIFILPAVLLGYISYWSSNRMDNDIYNIKPVEEKAITTKKNKWEGMQVVLQMLFLVVLTIAALFFIQWLISTF